MSASKSSVRAVLEFLCLILFCTQCCLAQGWTKDPTTWWPDTSTGLMWAGQVHGNPHPNPKDQSACCQMGSSNGLNWQQANDYCASLQLGGFAGWRLPTLDEVKAATVIRKTVGPYPTSYGTEGKAMREQDDAVSQMPYDALFFKKGGIDTFGPMMIWTSTLSQTDAKSAWVSAFEAYNPFYTALMVYASVGAECVRPITEPDLLQAAKAAEVNHPVPDLQTLRTFIPLNKARLAYQAGNYQESVSQAQIAVSLKADPATAYWGIGISYGRLGQWDQAVSNLQSALAIDKNYRDAETALKWAKDGLQAAKKGKQPKEPSPKWN